MKSNSLSKNQAAFRCCFCVTRSLWKSKRRVRPGRTLRAGWRWWWWGSGVASPKRSRGQWRAWNFLVSWHKWSTSNSTPFCWGFERPRLRLFQRMRQGSQFLQKLSDEETPSAMSSQLKHVLGPLKAHGFHAASWAAKSKWGRAISVNAWGCSTYIENSKVDT